MCVRIELTIIYTSAGGACTRTSDFGPNSIIHIPNQKYLSKVRIFSLVMYTYLTLGQRGYFHNWIYKFDQIPLIVDRAKDWIYFPKSQCTHNFNTYTVVIIAVNNWLIFSKLYSFLINYNQVNHSRKSQTI